MTTDSSIPAWKQKAAKKREEQYSRIPVGWRLDPLPSPLPKSTLAYIESSELSILTAEEREITSVLSAQELLAKIQRHEYSAEAVTVAFCKRAAIAHQLCGCCTEMFFDKAIQQARRLDRHQRETGNVVGPLHGLPISLKDNVDVEGEDTSIGWVGLCGRPAEKDSLLAASLKKQGAVLYCKTNVPQSLMMSDSYNHVFKQSVNSLNRELISGGSSGGEGALVSSHGSIVGIGTDIGGSIRIPGSLQGLYSLCPSTGRIPWDNSITRNYNVNPVAGPIASHLSTIETFMKGLLQSEPWRHEPSSYPIPWREELAARPTRPLRIGYIVDDGMVKVQPPVERAVLELVEKLRTAGHDVFEWDASSHQEAYQLWLKAVLADGGQKCKRLCEETGEPLIEGMLVGTEKDLLDVAGIEELSAMRLAYQKSYLRRWEDAKVDALVMPVLPWVGYPPKTWVKSSQNVSYTAVWNFVNFAALTVPVTTARPDETGSEEWKAWKDKTRDVSDRFNWEQYDPELVAGMPVCVQVVGGLFGEENCVAVAKVVDDLLGNA